MTQHTYAHSKTVESPISHAISRVWYWIWGEISEAAGRALKLQHIETAEFVVSAALIALGIWMLLPGGDFYVGKFTEFITMFIPYPIWGILFVVIGRLGLHVMLRDDVRKSEWSVMFVLVCWVFLTMVSLAVHPLGIETALLGCIALRTGYLYWQIGTV